LRAEPSRDYRGGGLGEATTLVVPGAASIRMLLIITPAGMAARVASVHLNI